MGQKKGKDDQSSTNIDGTAMILDYIHKQNRPYSAVDVSVNLHNKVTKGGESVYTYLDILSDGEPKAYAAKALRELCQNREIGGRTSGKQTVYHALQDSPDGTTPEIIAALEQGIKQCRGHISTIRTNEKQTKSELAEFVARPLLSELHCDIERLKKEKEGILVDLAKFGEGELNAASPEEKTAIEKEWKYWQKQVNVRKQICHDMWRRCSEVLPEGMTPEELKESLGLEGPLI